jgi:uncharacterized membrane protein YgcG
MVMMTALVISPLAADAQVANDLCTQRVYDGMAEYDIRGDDLEDLNSTMNSLSDQGIEPHAVFLDTLGSGVADVPQYEREVLQSDCPQLFNGSEPKPDLFMLIVSADRQMGTVRGSVPSRVHSFADYQATSVSYFQGGDFAGGLEAYFGVISDRLEGGNDAQLPSTGGGDGRSESQQSEDKTDWSWLKWAGIVLAVIVLVVVVWRLIARAQDRKRRRARLLRRYGTAKEDYYNLSEQSAHVLSAVQMWTTHLPDSDETDLVQNLRVWDDANARATEAVQAGTGSITSAKSDEQFDDAEELVGGFERAVVEAEDALATLKGSTDELSQLKEDFERKDARASEQIEAIRRLIHTRKTEGFKANGYIRSLEALEDRLGEARQSSGNHAVRTANEQIELVDQGGETLAKLLADLPKRAGRILARVNELRSRSVALASGHSAAKDGLDGLAETYDESCWRDLDIKLSKAGTSLDKASQALEAAEHAANMESQAFDVGDQRVDEAEAELESVAAAVDEAMAREPKLQQLAESLEGDVAELSAEVDGIIDFVDEAPEGYVNGDTINAAKQLRSQVKTLSMKLDNSKPAYLEIGQNLTSLKGEANEVNQSAKSEYNAAAAKVRQAKERAEARLRDAGQYRTYAGSRYSSANDLLTGMVVGMTLQDQLNHYDHAYDAADSAYDHGHSAWQDAQPSYNSYGGGSDGSSWDFSSSGGSDGGGWGGSDSSGGSDGGSW